MATTTMPAPESQPQPQAAISPLGRIFGVFFSPKATFADIARRPSWIAPMAVLMLTGIVLNIALAVHTNWTQVSRDQIERSKFASRQFDKLDDAAKAQAFEQAAQRAKTMRYVRAVIGWPLLLLFATAVYFGAYRLIGGGRMTFGLSFVIVAFAHLPVALKEILGTVVTMLRDPSAIDPDNYLASNPAALMGSDTPIWQIVPLAFLDVFAIWAIILVAIGFAASDPKKLPLGKSMGIAFGVQAALILFFTMLAFAFS
jgi:hypothetical protein